MYYYVKDGAIFYFLIRKAVLNCQMLNDMWHAVLMFHNFWTDCCWLQIFLKKTIFSGYLLVKKLLLNRFVMLKQSEKLKHNWEKKLEKAEIFKRWESFPMLNWHQLDPNYVLKAENYFKLPFSAVLLIYAKKTINKLKQCILVSKQF